MTSLPNLPLSNVIRDLWSNVRNTDMHAMSFGAVGYDTAWTARIQQNGKPLFPMTIQWLLDNQYENGSWGSKSEVFFDTLLTTVATINTFDQFGKFEEQVDRGLKWITDNIHRLENFDPTLSGIGFGILLPPQLSEIEERHGVSLGGNKLLSTWQKKMEQMTYDQILREHSHLAWNLEFLDTLEYDSNLLDRQLVGNGSIVCSNAASAWYVLQEGTHRDWTLQYLQSELRSDGAVSQFSPIHVFNRLWQVYPIFKALDYVPDIFFNDFVQMKRELRPDGIPMGEHFPFCDSDDTAVLFHLLYDMNLLDETNRYMDMYKYFDVDNRFFENYVGRHGKSTSRALDTRTNDRFTLSANIHMFEAYISYPENEHSRYVVDKLDNAFGSYLSDHDYFSHDRWHYSPAYGNAQAVYGFSTHRPDWAEQCVRYFFDTQMDDGHFGTHANRTELNAFAVAAISHYHNNVEKIDIARLFPAVEWLVNHPSTTSNMWISKTLYHPEFNNGLVLGALLEYYKATDGIVPKLT